MPLDYQTGSIPGQSFMFQRNPSELRPIPASAPHLVSTELWGTLPASRQDTEQPEPQAFRCLLLPSDGSTGRAQQPAGWDPRKAAAGLSEGQFRETKAFLQPRGWSGPQRSWFRAPTFLSAPGLPVMGG